MEQDFISTLPLQHHPLLWNVKQKQSRSAAERDLKCFTIYRGTSSIDFVEASIKDGKRQCEWSFFPEESCFLTIFVNKIQVFSVANWKSTNLVSQTDANSCFHFKSSFAEKTVKFVFRVWCGEKSDQICFQTVVGILMGFSVKTFRRERQRSGLFLRIFL
jgi:hypothetical protein